MKTIGMLGGMSWESTLNYYKIINETVKEKLGGLHSAKICMQSVNFEEIEKLIKTKDWNSISRILLNYIKGIESGKADFLIICTNTMHKILPLIEKQLTLPVLHIADATSKAVKKMSIGKVGLLGTRPTMEDDFYKKRLIDKHGINVVIPNPDDRIIIDNVIFNELCRGIIIQRSKAEYTRIINNLIKEGAQGIILGCTEIAMLIEQKDIPIPIFDTTEIHAKAAVHIALGINDFSEFTA